MTRPDTTRPNGPRSDGPPPRLLYMTPNEWVFWMHRRELARKAMQRGFEVHLATPEGPRRKEFEKMGFHYHPLRLNRKSVNPLLELVAAWDTWRIMRNVRPDVVDLRALKSHLYGGLAALACGVGHIFCAVTGLGTLFLSDKPQHALPRQLIAVPFGLFLRNNPRVTFLVENRDDRDEFVRRDMASADQCIVMNGTGVDLSAFTPTPEPKPGPDNTVIVETHCRLIRDKGVHDLVHASRILKRRGVPCIFRLAGTPDPGNPFPIAESDLHQWQAQGLIDWVGFVDDTPGFIRSAHISCLPSYREGTPVALMEAAACGRPIIATDAPGCRETVVRGQEENGLLVPLRDPMALADAVQALAENPERRRAMGRAGRRLAEARFDADTMCETILNLYEQSLAGPVLARPASREKTP